MQKYIRPSDKYITFWVVYDHPKDYPQNYVLRGQDVHPGGKIVIHQKPEMITDSLTEIRKEMVERGLTIIHRDPDDDPVIVESWV